MSHFIRCDRCDKQTVVIGKLSLPPGWQTICYADLCEPCCQLVHDFVRFRSSDAARLPVEPIGEPVAVPPADPAGEKLFATAPESIAVDDVNNRPMSTEKRGPDASLIGESVDTREQPSSSGTNSTDEASTEERNREKRRKTKARLQGQDAILPDPRKPQRPGEPGAPA